MKTNLITLLALLFFIGCNQTKSSSEIKTGNTETENDTNESVLTDIVLSETETLENSGVYLEEIKFPIAYIWEYNWKYNEEYQDYEDSEGEMWAYYHPELKYWLFTREQSYGIYGDMYDWVLVKPDGTCLFQTQSEFGDKKEFFELKIDMFIPDNLDDSYSPTGKEEKFVYELFNNLTFNGIEYLKTYEKTSEETYVYLADTDINLSPVYNFNALQNQTEIKLPLYFQTDLPTNKVLLRETTDAYYGSGKIELKWITHTEYYIYITEEPLEIYE